MQCGDDVTVGGVFFTCVSFSFFFFFVLKIFDLFFLFFQRFLTFGQVKGNTRDSRSQHRPTKFFEFVKVNLQP